MSKKKHSISRRRFIAYTVGGIGLAGVGAIPLSREPFYGAKYPEVEENKVKLEPNDKTVCILGGGLAGLQAGVELSSRGFKVVVLEKSGIPGGKLKSWRDKTFGPKDHPLKKDPKFKGFIREHGAHGVWGFYNNLREFMGRYGFKLQDFSKNHSLYSFLDKNRTHSIMPKSTWIAPYNRLQQFSSINHLKFIDESERSPLRNAILKFYTFDYTNKKQREYMDSMTFEEYGKKLGLPDSVIYQFFNSLLETGWFSTVDKCSALTIANLMQLISGSPDDMSVSMFTSPPSDTFLKPMADYIIENGGEIHYNTEVMDIKVKKGVLKSVSTHQLVKQKVRRCQVCGELVYGDDHPVCPFCGAEKLQLKVLTESEKSHKTFTADYFITAMDIPAVQKFISSNTGIFASDPYFRNILKLHTTEVYIVNFWIEGTKFWNNLFLKAPELAGSFMPIDSDTLGFTLNWSLIPQDENDKRTTQVRKYVDHDVSIIETQIAKVHNIAHLSDKEIADQCYKELAILLKDLPPYQSYYINKWKYTGYVPGDESNRPPIQSPIDNLLFIGDMVYLPHPAIFMEKTNVSAKWATNILLNKIGQKEGLIKILRSGTPSAFVRFIDLFYSVYI